ncbi:Crp/Fnr family transcriptional regulator [Aquimarina sp. D1M17]|uniref:Crp/Fnr family transcriptional regulator n=1 Tax=Aquimarina acroporae TaxID=2937283 RepID=UPI0020C149E3|nr:Crp/Fnr family transcriptional regulator [Aquimarina acroporae]MCK8522962.1 Crp/Fnr family transcriptional regulator [Aquimarina acroporae]
MNTENLLVEYFSQYMSLTEEEIKLIKKEDIIREYKKDHILLEEGQIAKVCFLVLKGCVKRYYLEDGEERIMEFYTENDPIAPVSYVNQEPSKYYLSCVEPCIISTGNEESTQRFIQNFPQFVPMFIKIGDSLSVKKQMSFDDFKNLSPEDRYQKLVATRPDLIHRVPQYMIASYLGIKPESLSRIRKRLSTK